MTGHHACDCFVYDKGGKCGTKACRSQLSMNNKGNSKGGDESEEALEGKTEFFAV